VVGSPLLRAVVTLAILLLLLVPLRSFTTARSQPVALAPAATPEPAETAHLEITSTQAPFHYVVEHLGKPVWQGDSPDADVTTDLQLPIPKEGIDLLLKVTWPGSGPAAAKLTLAHGDNDPVAQTVWGDGNASAVLTYP
jgi:hypothetical protein